MSTHGGQDRLYTALNPLVLDGTLTPHQADRVYYAVGHENPDSPPGSRPVSSDGWDRQQLFAAGSVLAAGFLVTAYIVGIVVDEDQGTGWKPTVMLIGTALVVAAAGAAWLLLLRTARWASWVSGVLGAIGLGALIFALRVLWNDSDAATYVTGFLMLAAGAAAFWFLEGQLYTLVAVFGGVLVLGQILVDNLGDGGDEGDVLTAGIAFLLYGLALAAAGWFLGSRRLLGFTGLLIGVTSMLLVILVDATVAAFSAAFSDPALSGADGLADSAAGVRSDIRAALFLGLLVVVVAGLAHAYDGFNGFAVLAFAGAAVLPVTAFYAWRTDHPLRWATAFAVVGALGLAAVIALQADRRRPRPAGYAGQPLPPDHGPDPDADTIHR